MSKWPSQCPCTKKKPSKYIIIEIWNRLSASTFPCSNSFLPVPNLEAGLPIRTPFPVSTVSTPIFSSRSASIRTTDLLSHSLCCKCGYAPGVVLNPCQSTKEVPKKLGNGYVTFSVLWDALHAWKYSKHSTAYFQLNDFSHEWYNPTCFLGLSSIGYLSAWKCKKLVMEDESRWQGMEEGIRVASKVLNECKW